MQHRTTVARILVATLAFAAAPPASGRQRPIPPDKAGPLVIQNVTLVAPDGLKPAMTVVVRADRIAAVGPALELKAETGAVVVDGSGKFLIPGLIDLHTHLSKTRASALGLFTLNGVTTIRDMGGDYEELVRWRQEINAGTRVGPRIKMAGPYLEAARNIERMRKDPPSERVEPFERTRIGVASPEDARRIVAELASRDIDFIKIRTVENRETYLALNAASDSYGIPLVGHVTGIPPEAVLDAGQDGVEHVFYPSTDATTPEARLALWRKFAARGIPIVPTLTTLFQSTFPPVEHLRAMLDDSTGTLEPRRPYVSKFLLLDWREQLAEANEERTRTLRKIWEDVIRRDLREMHAAGMDLLVGSDVAVLNVFPGSSAHEEMALFVSELGMTPAEALDRATRRSAQFLRLGDSIGSIERGKIADLVLLSADPLTDIRNTTSIVAVVQRGRYLDSRALDALRRNVLSAPDLRIDDWGRTAKRKK